MFIRLFRKFKLFLNPPKKGDIYFGDPVWFVISRPVELVLHNLKDKYGTNMYNPIPSKGCFKFTVEHIGNFNYILGSEVLCRNKFSSFGAWMKRTQPRRMSKEMFEEFMLMGLLWRE